MQTIEHQAVARQNRAERRATSISNQQAQIRHVAVILDDNRRWARQRGLPAINGYRTGGDNVHRFPGWCEEMGIPLVTLWPLSAENLRRDPQELHALLSVIADVFDELTDSGRWCLQILGDLARLPPTAALHVTT